MCLFFAIFNKGGRIKKLTELWFMLFSLKTKFIVTAMMVLPCFFVKIAIASTPIYKNQDIQNGLVSSAGKVSEWTFDKPIQRVDTWYDTDGPSGSVHTAWWSSAKLTSAVQNKATSGYGVEVAVFDSLIRCDHYGIQNKPNGDCSQEISTSGTYADWSQHNHGAHVAGLIGGIFGVANQADLVGYGIFDDNGWVSTSFVTNALDHAKRRGVKVNNHSWGIDCADNQVCEADIWAKESSIAKKHNSQKNNILNVWAAGNHYTRVGTYQMDNINKHFKNNVLKSKGFKNLLLVGALGRDGRTIADFSVKPGNGCLKGWGENQCKNSNRYKFYFVVAPGYTVSHGSSSTDSVSGLAGTSMAAPIVSGQAALIAARWPRLKPVQIRKIIMKTATDLGRKGVDPVYGWGRVNIGKSMKPVRGRVGGINIRNNNLAFRVNEGGGLLRNAPTIYDAWNRDFDLVNRVAYSAPFEEVFVPVAGNDISKNGIYAFTRNDGTYDLNGFKLGGVSYVQNRQYSTPFYVEDFKSNNTVVPKMLRPVISGQSLLAMDLGSYGFFTTRPSKKNENVTKATAIGINVDLTDYGYKNGTAKYSLVQEQGLWGINSDSGFGFSGETTSHLVGVSLPASYMGFDTELNVDHIFTKSGETGEFIDRGSMSATEVYGSLSRKVGGNGKLGYSFTSGMMADGDIDSNIQGLSKVSNFYSRQPQFGVFYKKKVMNSGAVRYGWTATSRNEQEAQLSLSLPF